MARAQERQQDNSKVRSIMARRWLERLTERLQVAFRRHEPARLPQPERQSFALNELDLQLARYLGDRTGGFFIEAGGNDGINQSNTLYFERYLGWRGLLIEPVPELAARCRINRPQSIVENAALVPLDYAGATVAMRYCDLMSVVRGGMRSPAEEDAHIAAGSAVQHIESYDLVVPARPLQSILDQHHITSADLFVLDVEGFEAAALRGIDFDRFVAHNLLVEARYRDDVEAVLKGHYKLVEQLSHHDLLYRPVKERQSNDRQVKS